MAQLPGGGFDANEVDPTSQFDPIPSGDYPMMITESELKPTKKNDGSYLQMTIEVIDGQYKGRKVWERLNLDNPNETAREIAYRTLSAICHAVGKMQVADSSELHNLPFIGTVKFKPADGQYDAGNEMKGYKKYQGAVSGAAPQPGQAQSATPAGGGAAGEGQSAAAGAPQPGAGDSTPPWARKQ